MDERHDEPMDEPVGGGRRAPEEAAAAERFGRYLDALLGSGRPSPDEVVDDDEAEMARLAAELSGAGGAADPDTADPDPAFLEQLRLRMRQADEGISAVSRPLPLRPRRATDATPARGERPGILRMRVSRRAALQTGLGAAAGLAAGIVGGAVLRDAVVDEVPAWPPEQDLVAGEGEWVQVATRQELPDGEVMRFSTPAFDGFVVNDRGEIRALAAACTHLGCSLQYRAQFHDLRCPCHGASFNLRGWLANSRGRWRQEGPYPGDERAYPLDLPPLPQPKVKLDGERILVLTAKV